MAKQKQRELRAGDRFTFIDDPRQRPYVVLRVSPCSAIVRSEVGSHEVIRNDDGSIKAEFDRPGSPTSISVRSFVRFL